MNKTEKLEREITVLRSVVGDLIACLVAELGQHNATVLLNKLFEQAKNEQA